MFAENLAPFFSDFADAATIGSATVMGNFDAGNTQPFTGQFESASPTFECAAAAVAGVAQGDTVVVRGKTYKVRHPIEYPGDGAIAVLRLEAQ